MKWIFWYGALKHEKHVFRKAGTGKKTSNN
jgi:hypothetical protein